MKSDNDLISASLSRDEDLELLLALVRIEVYCGFMYPMELERMF
jgi:hypothetical protein